MEENEKQKKKNRKIIPVMLILLIICGAVYGMRQYIYSRNHEDTDNAQIDADVSPVIARVGGYIDSILIEDYQRVSKGQTLVKLDDRDLAVQLKQAEAKLHNAHAGTKVSGSQIGSAIAFASATKANVEISKAKLLQIRQDYQRYANLVQSGAITRQRYEQVKAELDAAEAAYQGAQEQYKSSQEAITTARSQSEVTKTGVEQSEADVEFAGLQLSYTVIKSPLAGRVSKKKIQPGQLVQAGQTLFYVVDEDNVYVTANFKETQMADIKPGQKVTIKVDAFPDLKLKGTVYGFSPATGAKFSLLPPDNATGNFVKIVQRIPVKIKIQADRKTLKTLRPGLNVHVSVLTKE